MKFYRALKIITEDPNATMKAKQHHIYYYITGAGKLSPIPDQVNPTIVDYSLFWFMEQDWEIFPLIDLLTRHTFEEALAAFKKGKQITRAGACQWHDKSNEHYIVPSGDFFCTDWLIREKP